MCDYLAIPEKYIEVLEKSIHNFLFYEEENDNKNKLIKLNENNQNEYLLVSYKKTDKKQTKVIFDFVSCCRKIYVDNELINIKQYGKKTPTDYDPIIQIINELNSITIEEYLAIAENR